MADPILIAAFYKFNSVDDPSGIRHKIEQAAQNAQVHGTILVADEGINGTIAGPEAGVKTLLKLIRDIPEFSDLDHKEAQTDESPFRRLKVRLKKEIVAMGVEQIDPPRQAGTYVDPISWNELVSDPDVLVIDTRNDYEYRVGTFRNAVNPKTESFREFPQWAEAELDPEEHQKVAMFCTGGIRCEKATSLLKNRGFDEVYHLEGGILKYLETVDQEVSLWEGECFVFDERVSVNHELRSGTWELCHACRMPVNPQDRDHPKYEEGVSCPACYDERSDQDRERFRERQRQIRLATKRGEAHIGDAARERLKRERS